MKLDAIHKKIWKAVQSDLENEPVASTDHVDRMTTWCQRLGRDSEADLDILTAGALVHDIGVTIDRKTHYVAGRKRAEAILNEAGFPGEKIGDALHVMEAHSRYGGPDPHTAEAQIGQDADALEYIGAIGIIRAVVRGLNDGSYDGKISGFPDFLRSILAKVEDTFHTKQAEVLGINRIKYMKQFLERIEKELNYEV